MSTRDGGVIAGMSDEVGVSVRRARLPGRVTWSIWLAVGAAIASTMLVAEKLAELPALPGRMEADNLTGVISVFGDLLARLAWTAVLGGVAALVAFFPAGADGAIAPGARRLALWVGRVAQLWLVAAILMTFANPAFVTGIPIGYTFRLDVWLDFFTSAPTSLAWLGSAAAALATALVAYRATQVSAFVVCFLAGAISAVFVAVTGNVSVGLDHDWATDAMGVATLALLVLSSGAIGVVASAAAGGVDVAAGVRRYHRLALGLIGLAAAGYGVAAWQQLAGRSVFEVVAGVPMLACFGCGVLLLASWVWRQAALRTAADSGRLVAAVARDIVLLVFISACQTASAHLPPPVFDVPQTSQVNYLGYDVNLPATLERLAGLGRPNLLWVLLAASAIIAYCLGVVRVVRKGGRWPVWRVFFWLAGWCLVLYLATSGLWMYSTAVFSWHMLVHMTVNMMVPVLCVLGSPFGLIEAGSRERGPDELPGPRVLLSGLVANRLVRFLLSPPVLWLNYVGSLFVVYFTPLFPWLMRYHWAHQLMLLHFLIAGYAFFGLLVGPDRHPWQLPYLVRFALLMSIMPFHAIFAVGIMMARSIIGEQFYNTIAVTWVGDLLADQNNAGQITWFTGEVPAFLAVVMLAAQWFRSDSTEAAVADRIADAADGDELGAYNDMLAQLAERPKSGSHPGGDEW